MTDISTKYFKENNCLCVLTPIAINNHSGKLLMKTRNAKIHQAAKILQNRLLRPNEITKFTNALIFLQMQQIQLFHYSAVNSKPRIL